MSYDVVIAGGGPVGLFVACELGLAGVSVVVLEKMEDARSPLKEGWMGMRGLNVPSVEALYRRGLLDGVKKSALGWFTPGEDNGIQIRGTGEQGAARPPRFAGHFAGIMLDIGKMDFSKQKYLMGGPSAGGGMISLEAIELLLEERAQGLGVEIVRGAEVTSLAEDADGVTVEAGGRSYAGRWLVGCDGGRSAVRKLAGFAFEGTEPEFTGYVASVKLADGEKLKPGFNLTPTGMYVNGPGPDRIGVVEFDGAAFDRTSTVTRENMQAVLRRVSGTDVTVTEMGVASTYTDRARQTTTYRRGRVLLAGDAAHIHSPLGGQGLNTGIGDAMNLGWKLAATVKGWAPAGLLDSYTEERHPIGAWTVNWTRAQVAIMRPDAHAQAIAAVVRDLIETGDGTSYFVGKTSGLMMHYDLGGGHPVVGWSAPDFELEGGELEDGTRLGELLREGKGLLLDLGESDELRELGGRWAGRVRVVAAKAKDSKGLSALLVRPDGFVAWAAAAELDLKGAESALERWFGAAQG